MGEVGFEEKRRGEEGGGEDIAGVRAGDLRQGLGDEEELSGLGGSLALGGRGKGGRTTRSKCPSVSWERYWQPVKRSVAAPSSPSQTITRGSKPRTCSRCLRQILNAASRSSRGARSCERVGVRALDRETRTHVVVVVQSCLGRYLWPDEEAATIRGQFRRSARLRRAN